jgi:hypothetical protein
MINKYFWPFIYLFILILDFLTISISKSSKTKLFSHFFLYLSEIFSMDTYCNSCKTFKQSYEFIGYGAKDTSKQFKTCNSYRQRFNKKDL